MSLAPRPVPEKALCRHCGAALEPSASDEFCCLGCRAAYRLIDAAGLASFYQHREQKTGIRPLKPDGNRRPDAAFNVLCNGGECSLHLMIDGLHCAACVWLIERMLEREADILAARVNFTQSRLKIAWRGAPERAEALVALIEDLGFRAMPFDPARLDAMTDQTGKELVRAMAVAGFAAANVMLLSVAVWSGHAGSMGGATRDLLHWLSALIALPCILFAGRPFFGSALRALSRRHTNMDVPISLGILLASAMSLSETIRHGPYAYFDSALTLLFFLLIGRLLDHRARGKTRAAAAHLLSLNIAGVNRIDRSGQVHYVALGDVAIGDELLVAAGEKIAADGELREGHSDIDTALVTGETVPLAAAAGTRLFAGMINLTGAIKMRVTAVGEQTLLAEIVRLMEAACNGRGHYRLLADRLSRLYAPVVHLAALATFLYWLLAGGVVWQVAMLRAVAVLIITCPCALGLAIPAVQIVASHILLKRGILLKSATALERLADIDRVVFDKTGTLTRLEPLLRTNPPIEPRALATAAGLARASLHPLCKALSAACPVAPMIDHVEELPGRGLRAGKLRLGSRAWLGLAEDAHNEAELWLDRPGTEPQRFAFEEQPRPDAEKVIAWLRKRQIGVALASGDRPAAVKAMADRLAITAWHGGMDPTAKLALVTKLKESGRRVLMVGDGLNDAPSLAAADVSLSPANATDITQIQADILFQGESLAPIAWLLAVARRARGIIRQNLAFAVIYNLAAIPLAVAGLATPPIAALLMSSSSLLVVLNALRLHRLERGSL